MVALLHFFVRAWVPTQGCAPLVPMRAPPWGPGPGGPTPPTPGPGPGTHWAITIQRQLLNNTKTNQKSILKHANILNIQKQY